MNLNALLKISYTEDEKEVPMRHNIGDHETLQWDLAVGIISNRSRGSQAEESPIFPLRQRTRPPNKPLRPRQAIVTNRNIRKSISKSPKHNHFEWFVPEHPPASKQRPKKQQGHR